MTSTLAHGRATLRILAVLTVLLATAGMGQSASAQQTRLEGVDEQTGILYRTVDGQRLFFDAYIPETSGRHPAIVAAHGGGFTGGIRKFMRSPCILLAKNGFACFTIDYRLAPEAPYPAPVEDMKAAIEFIRQHAGEFSVDPVRMGVLGSSAGGTIAATVGADSHGDHHSDWQVAAAAAWSSPLVFAQRFLGQQIDSGGRQGGAPLIAYIFGEEGTASTLASPSPAEIQRIEAADPSLHVAKTSPPFYVANSTAELVSIEQPMLFQNRLESLGVENQVDIVPGRRHGTQLMRFVAPDTVEFFQAHVARFVPQPQTKPPPLQEPDGPAGNRRNLLPIMLLVIAAVVVALVIGRAVRART